MLKPHQEKQIESLQKTTTTKAQIIDKIKKTPIKTLKATIPQLSDDITKEEIIASASMVLEGRKPLDPSNAAVEAVVLWAGRPVFFVKNGTPIVPREEIDNFQNLVSNALTNLNLKRSINSIGRIELDNHPRYLWAGTGWLFADNLLMTNRHVADHFIERNGNGFRFLRFSGNPVKARVDFLAEHDNSNAAEFSIVDCLYLGESRFEDIAILRVTLNDKSYAPLDIFGGKITLREDIAVVGYPAFDSFSSMGDKIKLIYNNVFDIKRFAPGKIMDADASRGLASHDATTLPGNSGSAMISLKTGKVIGLHFAGEESSANYFVDAATVLKAINKVPTSKIYSLASSTLSEPPAFDASMLEANRLCQLEDYAKINVPSFRISGRMIAYASPDSTFHVTKKLFRKATKSILIGIYDFTAEHVYTCIEEAIDRGVAVSLMLDIDGEPENKMFKKLKHLGVECVPAPSCTSKNARYFASSHEKVIVIDEKWTMIQSGNYSKNSCPFNELDGDASQGFKKGSRDMGIAIESKPLARFFTKLLRSDMKLELDAASIESFERVFENNEFLLEATPNIPDPLFPSKEFNPDGTIKIQPVLTPDNYIDEISKLLKSATRSIKIEQQYIRVGQAHIDKLIDCIPDGVDVQIILARPIANDPKPIRELNALRDMGYDVRFLSTQFNHCHNKLIVVDEETVVISSQNWSNTAVATNREAGVIIYDRGITNYFSKIFDADWTMSDEAEDESAPATPEMRTESFGEQPGKFALMDIGDVREV